MHTATLNKDSCPWYKQLWPWLLISLPASAVLGGIATFILAVNSPNALVANDYYKQGLAINQQTGRLRVASELGIEALVHADKQTLQLKIQADNQQLPTTLKLEFIHATRDDLDQNFTMKRVSNQLYSAPYQPLHRGNWYLRIRPVNAPWELSGQAYIDNGLQTRLSGLSETD